MRCIQFLRQHEQLQHRSLSCCRGKTGQLLDRLKGYEPGACAEWNYDVGLCSLAESVVVL